MAWTYNGYRIYVQNKAETVKQTIARLQPLSGGTVLHIFGYESNVIKLNGVIVGDTIKGQLVTLIDDAAAYALVSPEGSLGNFYLSSLTFSRESVVYQTIDTAQADSVPVYSFEMELYA